MSSLTYVPDLSFVIGILHSQTGVMAASELPLIDAALMAIDEINSAGGILGRPLRPVVRDGASSAIVFSAQLKELIAVKQVTTFFGGWSSDVRKALVPTLEKYNALLWYPLQYEGLEASRNVFYTGICPNQLLEPTLNWLLQHRGKRLFLIGSDSIFSRTINKLLRAQFTMQGGEIVQECYVPIRSADFTAELEAIQALQPQAVFSTLGGDRSPEFYRQYHRLGLSPEQSPILAIGIGEDQLASLREAAVGHYLAWNYFQSLGTPENQAFVQRFKRRYGSDRIVSAPMEAAYSQIYLWKQSVEAAGTFDVDQVRVSAYGECFAAPSGPLTLEHNHHVARHCRIGAVQPNGSVQIVYSTPEALPPSPWLGVESANLSNASVVIQILAEFSQTLQQKSVIEQKSTELEEIMVLFEAQILERKRAEQELRLLLSVSQAMSQAVDLNSALTAALAQISDLTQWPYGEVWFPNAAKTHLKTGDVWYLAEGLVSEEQGAGLKRFRTYSETTEFGVDEGFLGLVYTSAATQWTQKFGLYGAVGVPILSPTVSDTWDNSDESVGDRDLNSRDLNSRDLNGRDLNGLDLNGSDTNSNNTSSNDTSGGESALNATLTGRKVLAILIFLLPEEREEDQRLIELISAVATQLGTFVQQKKAEEALRTKNQQLGTTLRQLKLTQTELVQSEKMAALGQLVAGVAHEINTPLGAICSSAEYISDFLAQDLEKLPDFFRRLSSEKQSLFIDLFHQTRRAKPDLCNRDRRQARRRVLAQLEAANLEARHTLTELVLDVNLQDQPEVFLPLLREPEGQEFLETLCCIWELCNSSRDIIMAAGRASKVVFALKTYTSYDHSSKLVAINLVDSLEAVLTLYASKLRSNVEVVRNYGDRLPLIQGNPEELSQVWMNLIHNALHAMEEKGKLLIEIQNLTNVLEVRITDSGCGIPPEVLPQIFQPFFTTKPAGEGSGLGLDIAQKIIRHHQGTIAVRSVPGQTSFTVNLPLQRSSESSPSSHPEPDLVPNVLPDLVQDSDDFEPQITMQTDAEMQRLMRTNLPSRNG